MSGGEFDGKEFNAEMVAEQIWGLLKGPSMKGDKEIEDLLKLAARRLHVGYRLAVAIDYYFSGDIGRDECLRRAEEDLRKGDTWTGPLDEGD